MAYVSVAEWRPEQVTEWLKGLDNSIISYIHWFSNNEVNGQQLLNLTPDELTHLGVYKLGHQELILEAVQHLRNFHYELDRENLQLLALKLSCAAHSLYSEIKDQAESSSVPTQVMADVANVIHNVKPLVSWLDRPPFSGQIQYSNYKSQLLHLSLEMATCAQRDRFAERPVAKIRTCSSKLAELADSIVQDIKDPMILQPATLDLATIKKKAGEDLDFFLVPSFHGIHQIGDMKLSSPAHQSGKIQQGDEIVQVNYQTVVGWSRKKVLALFEESPNDLLLTLKRRPRHVKMYGQIYMKPYRLPSRKRASPYSRWNDSLPSPRPELLTIPHFNIISGTVSMSKKGEADQNLSLEPSRTSSSSDEEFGQQSDSPNPPMRLYLPKPRAPIQRRFTLSGPPRPSAQSEQFWRELQLERSWRSSQNNSQMNNSSTQNVGSNGENINEMFQLRDKSASLGNSIATASSRSTTCVPFTKARIGSVKFDLTKFDSHKIDLNANEKSPTEEKDGTSFESSLKTSSSDNNFNTEEPFKEGEATETPTVCKSLSISELNKLKRDAFFNNMECSNAQDESQTKSGQEGTSEKVKRVIENFKSEINTCKRDVSELDSLKGMRKVMELVENFEKKEVTDTVFKTKPQLARTEIHSKSPRGKNRLDKSCSAPAYDTTEEDLDDLKIDFSISGRENKRNFNVLTDISSGNNFSSERQEKFNLQPKMVVGENYKTDRTKDNHYQVASDVSTLVKNQEICYQESFPPNEDEASNERNNREKHARNESNSFKSQGDSVGNIYYKNNQRLQSPDLPWPESKVTERKNNEFKSDVCVSPSHSTYTKKEELIKPIPAQRKSKLSEKNITNEGYNNLGPLPPKPQPKNLTLTLEDNLNSNCIISNLQPPEPPPRPESTLPKSVSNKRSGLVFEHSREYESESQSESDSFRESPDPRALPRKGSITPSPSILTPSDIMFPFEVKPISPTVLSSGRKGTKQMNIVSPLPSPSVISPTAEKEKHKTSGSTLENLKAILTLGRKSSNINSPRSVRKKNAMLAKKRNVSVKEITHCENSGFLWHRNRKGSAVASWTKYFFILQGSNFYGFKTRESHKADLFIHLPGFTCTLAEEVKSKEFSFKIYHTGTVFYFAANSREDLQQWLDFVNVATSLQDEKSAPEVVTYSQTDSDDSDTEPELETCFPTSPKMKKVLGSSNTPKSSGSHQNLASEFKKQQDTQKRFGSLKKLTSPKHSNTYSSGTNDSSEVASLDRKYLRFLGQKNSPTPVPTSRFRSYRRMQPTPAVPPKGKSKMKSKNSEETNVTQDVPTKSGNQAQLMRKPLHSSNPSLIHPDMADYRATQERLAEFRRLRNQNRPPDSNRFINLGQFLQTRPENNLMGNSRERPPELSGFITLEQFLLRQEEERQRSNRIRERPQPSEFRSQEQPERTVEERHEHKRQIHSEKNSPSTSSLRLVDHTEKMNLEKPKVAPRKKDLISKISGPLKNVTTYQPPVIPHSSSTSNLGEDSITMAFEMSLDRREAPRIVHSPQSSVVSELPRNAESSRSPNNKTFDSHEIEYPPAFEPETHATQHMLKMKKNRTGNSEPNK